MIERIIMRESRDAMLLAAATFTNITTTDDIETIFLVRVLLVRALLVAHQRQSKWGDLSTVICRTTR